MYKPDLDIRQCLDDWVRQKFPHLRPFFSQNMPHVFYVEKVRLRLHSARLITAVVLELRPEIHWDALGGLMKTGIWTISELGKPWDVHDPTTVESPAFFDVFERIIKEEDRKWK